jgi:DNA-binding NarL/FixJ family response regulator
VETVRTILVGMTPLLRDIVRQSLDGKTNVEVVGEFKSDGWTERLRYLKPDVVIVSSRTNEADEVARRLLETAPFAKVVVLSSDSRRASFMTMRIDRLELSDPSIQEIADFIGRPR